MISLRSEIVDAKITFVMFRGDVLAFFRATKSPEETTWHKEETHVSGPNTCIRLVQACYAHVGQHGEADVEILRNARRATPDEYGPLLREMEDIGYHVTPHQFGRLKLTYDQGKSANRLDKIIAAIRDMTWDDTDCDVSNYRNAHNLCLQNILSIATGGRDMT